MNRWVVDAEHVVHEGSCDSIGDQPLPYHCRRPVVENGLLMGMHQWLEQSDISAGHRGPTRLRPCSDCLPADPP